MVLSMLSFSFVVYCCILLQHGSNLLLMCLCPLFPRNVLSIDEYASYFEHIDPLGKYKNWTNQQVGYDKSSFREKDRKNDPCSQRVQAVFIVSDSVDWSRDIQVFLYLNIIYFQLRFGYHYIHACG